MSVITSFVIPISDSMNSDDLSRGLIATSALIPFSEKVVKRKRVVPKLIVFKMEIEEEYRVTSGHNLITLNQHVQQVYSGATQYVDLGALSPEVSESISSSLKQIGDIADFQPGGMALQRDYEGSWGDDVFSYKGICLLIYGYGNPLGSGSKYVIGLLNDKHLGKALAQMGKVIPDVADSDCAAKIGANTIFVDLNC